MILHVPVQSSNVRSVGYDPETLTLEIQFKGGSIYVYTGVPADVHKALLGAASKGRFVRAHIAKVYPAMKR